MTPLQSRWHGQGRLRAHGCGLWGVSERASVIFGPVGPRNAKIAPPPLEFDPNKFITLKGLITSLRSTQLPTRGVGGPGLGRNRRSLQAGGQTILGVGCIRQLPTIGFTGLQVAVASGRVRGQLVCWWLGAGGWQLAIRSR